MTIRKTIAGLVLCAALFGAAGAAPSAFALNTSGPKNSYTPTNCMDSTVNLSVCESSFGDSVDTIVENYVTALQDMATQLSAVMMQYTGAIGMFFDAKIQMDTQLDLQTLQARAHKDYHPSEELCRIGSSVRSLAALDEHAHYTRRVLAEVLNEKLGTTQHASAYLGGQEDIFSRRRQFKSTYCNPADENGALKLLCTYEDEDGTLKTGPEDLARVNNDVDFAKLVGLPLTLDIDFTNNTAQSDDPAQSAAEEDVMALGRNLYLHDVLDPITNATYLHQYPRARQFIAMINMAHYSYAHYVSLKARAPQGSKAADGGAYIKALVKGFGLSDDDVDAMLGAYPSYYAQMDVLARKMVQHPDFYTNLYDKPANVERIGVSMDAIKLMQLRDWYETSLRRELLSSALLRDMLRPHEADAERGLLQN